MNEFLLISIVLPFASTEWAEWSRCTSWCSKGKQTRLWFDNVTQVLTESRDLQNSRQDCDGEDLFCALSLGLPGVFALVATLGIYTLCRSKSTSDLSRGRKALLSYRTVFGARKSRQKAEAARKEPTEGQKTQEVQER